MTFEQWYSELSIHFLEVGIDVSTTGWEWPEIFKEGLSPRAAFTDYMDTI